MDRETLRPRPPCHARRVEHVLAVDIGGTKMAAGVVGVDGQVVARQQVPTAGDGADVLVMRFLDEQLVGFGSWRRWTDLDPFGASIVGTFKMSFPSGTAAVEACRWASC